MKHLLTLIFCAICAIGYGQFAPTGTKTNFKNGIALGSKDSTAFGANDSLAVTIDRNGRFMYRGLGAGAYWKVPQVGTDTVPDTRFVRLQQPTQFRQDGGFWISDTGRTSRLFRAAKFYGDTLQSSSSAGIAIVSNNGTLVSLHGLAGSAVSTFSGFAGYLTNSGGSYTSRSFTDKNYVDSADALRTKYQVAAWGDSFTDYGVDFWQDSLSYWQDILMYNGGVPGEDAPAIRARMVAAVDKHKWPTIIWAGRNGFTDTAAVLSNIAVMVDTLRANRNERFYVVSILNPIGAPIGTGDYNLIIYLNNRLKALYPNNYIDLRRYLVLKYNPDIPQDVTDFTNDVIPSSLRVDGTHLNELGNYWTAVRFNQYFSKITGNPQQNFQNVVAKMLQVSGGADRDATFPGWEVFYDTTAKRAYMQVYDATVPSFKGMNIRSSDLNIVTDGGAITADGPTTINNRLSVANSVTVTDSISSAKILASALPQFTTGSRVYAMYDAVNNGELKYALEDSVKSYLNLIQYLQKSDTIGTGYTPYQRFYDSLTNIQTRIQTKQPLVTTGIANYVPKFTGASAFDTSIIATIGGRVGVGTTDIKSGFDIETSINGLPASSGSAPRGGLRVSNSNNVTLDFGNVSSGSAWIQVSDAGNYAANFPLLLNPNGGNIIIGSSTNGSDKLQVSGSGNFTSTVTALNTYTTSSTPSVAAGASAGSSPTISIGGTNQGFSVTLTPGTAPTESGILWTATFSGSFAYPNGCFPVFSPTSANSALLSGVTMVYTVGNTTTVTMYAGSTALTTGVTYSWNITTNGY